MAGVDLYLSGVVFLLGTGPGCGVEAGVGQPGSQSSREEVVGTDAEERHRVSFVSKSPSRSWACAGFVQGIAWRGEKGTTYRAQRNISYLLIMAGSRFQESPSFGPALFYVGFTFRQALPSCSCQYVY